MAAGLVAVIGLVWALDHRPEIYETEVGRVEQLVLADGTSVVLDADSRMTVRYREEARLVRLERGQALFTVQTDRRRPFSVAAGGGTVTALGTVFDVQRLPSGARVSLVEGAVRVDPADRTQAARTLRPGQSTTMGAEEPALVRADAFAATQWVAGRRVFSRTPVPEAVAALNRHGRTPIVLIGTGWERLRVSGSFRVDDTAGFARALVAIYGLHLTTTRDGTLTLALDPVRATTPIENKSGGGTEMGEG